MRVVVIGLVLVAASLLVAVRLLVVGGPATPAVALPVAVAVAALVVWPLVASS